MENCEHKIIYVQQIAVTENVENCGKNEEISNFGDEIANFKFKYARGANISKNIEVVSDYESEEETD